MDSAAYVALSTALERELPSVLEDMLLKIERTRMEREDLAARGVQGRFVANCHLSVTVQTRYWITSFQELNDDANLLELRQRRALQALSNAARVDALSREAAVAGLILDGRDDDRTDSEADDAMVTDDEEL